MSEFRVGDVVHYQTDNRWCKEETAIAREGRDGIVLADTFWGSGNDCHILRGPEIETAQVLFNLSDFRELDRHERHTWQDYNPADREVITSQHGLQKRLLIRLGARPDLVTKIENAREKVAEAERELSSAESRLKWAREDLANLEDGSAS